MTAVLDSVNHYSLAIDMCSSCKLRQKAHCDVVNPTQNVTLNGCKVLFFLNYDKAILASSIYVVVCVSFS